MNRILLIDDEEGIRETYKRFHDTAEQVFRGRLEMDVAEDLTHCKERLATKDYDALILDLSLVTLTDKETIREIRDNFQQWPPVIVITGDSNISTRIACMGAGAADFWLKTDATGRPDLFFKAVYNAHLRNYASKEGYPEA